jgi:hypothetical protein
MTLFMKRKFHEELYIPIQSHYQSQTKVFRLSGIGRWIDK